MGSGHYGIWSNQRSPALIDVDLDAGDLLDGQYGTHVRPLAELCLVVFIVAQAHAQAVAIVSSAAGHVGGLRSCRGRGRRCGRGRC